MLGSYIRNLRDQLQQKQTEHIREIKRGPETVTFAANSSTWKRTQRDDPAWPHMSTGQHYRTSWWPEGVHWQIYFTTITWESISLHLFVSSMSVWAKNSLCDLFFFLCYCPRLTCQDKFLQEIKQSKKNKPSLVHSKNAVCTTNNTQ